MDESSIKFMTRIRQSYISAQLQGCVYRKEARIHTVHRTARSPPTLLFAVHQPSQLLVITRLVFSHYMMH